MPTLHVDMFGKNDSTGEIETKLNDPDAEMAEASEPQRTFRKPNFVY
jgi:hypothetical protein